MVGGTLKYKSMWITYKIEPTIGTIRKQIKQYLQGNFREQADLFFMSTLEKATGKEPKHALSWSHLWWPMAGIYQVGKKEHAPT